MLDQLSHPGTPVFSFLDQSSKSVSIVLRFSKIYLFILEKREQVGGGTEGERESQAASLLSREPNKGLDPRTLGSRPELKADA